MPDLGRPESMTGKERRFTLEQGIAFVEQACVSAGASPMAAASLARATVSAETYGRSSVGFQHLPDYLDGFRSGRINGTAEPEIAIPLPALLKVDARGGIAQLGFDLAFAAFCQSVTQLGIAVFAQRNSFTAGEIGYYTRRLMKVGLVALAVSNGPPLLSPPGAKRPVYCTNPLAFGAPSTGGSGILIDQAASQTAFVSVRERAAKGEQLPAGWALDSNGEPTTDPFQALAGSLTTFGGARGANIALMVEIMAAGLTGANWSVDAPGFASGTETPGAGLFIIALATEQLAPGLDGRLTQQMGRLSGLGVHIPGRDRSEQEARARAHGFTVPAEIIERIEAFAV